MLDVPYFSTDVARQAALSNSSEFLDKLGPSGRSTSSTRRVSLLAILPAVLTFFATIGVAIALLAWLYVKRIVEHPPEEDKFFRNAIVAVELAVNGNRTSESFLYGLAIASVAGTIVPICVPLVMGVVTYRIAASWVAEQGGEPSAAPTPQQYALLLKVCGSSNLFAAYETSKYLLETPKNPRPTTASTLKRAFVALIFILFLSYGVGLADFWLHTTASSFVHKTFIPISSDMTTQFAALPMVGTMINETACPGPVPALRGTYLPDQVDRINCQSFVAASATDSNMHWGESNTDMFQQAIIGGSNQSSSNIVHLVSSESIKDIAVIVPPNLPTDGVNLTFPTFGISSQCQPVADCEADTSGIGSFLLCPSIQPPLNVTSLGDDWEVISSLNLSTKAVLYSGYSGNSTINPFGALFTFLYSSNDDIQKPYEPETAGWYLLSTSQRHALYQFFIATCEMKMYQLNLSATEGRYTIVGDAQLTDFNTTSALLAGYGTSLTPELMSILHRKLASSIDLSTETFLEYLATNASASSIGLTAPLMQRASAQSMEVVLLQTASRYPLPPLIVFLLLLFIFGLLALTASIAALLSRSPEINLNVTILSLAHRSLTDSAAVVSQHFESMDERDHTILFKEKSGTPRLGAGIGGNGTFGVRRVRRDSDSEDSRLSQLVV